MKTYLFYVSQIYSLSILRPLQDEIWRRGHDCAWFFDCPEIGAPYLFDSEKLLKTVAEVKEYNPLAVFVPGNVVPDFFPGVKVEIFHGLATDETGKKGHYRIRGFFDLYCTRGTEETANFQSLAEKNGHFHVVETGWPKLDPLFSAGIDTALRDQLQTEKPVILYGSTFSPSLTSAPALFETIRALSRNGKWHWLVTLHPKMDQDVVAKYRTLAGVDLSFFESHQDVLPLLKRADVMLCDTSSIAIEFQILNKPLVTYRTKVPGPNSINVTDVQDVENAISAALQYPKELMSQSKLFVNMIHPERDGRSSERVLTAVDHFIDHVAGTLKAKPLNILRKYKIRKRLGYYHIK